MTPDHELLEAALVGYQHQREQIDEKIAEIKRQLAGTAGSAAGSGPNKRVFSAAARKRMAEAQKKRWAQRKQGGEGAASAVPKKRKMSAAARKRIADAARKRWASYRAEKAG